MALLVLGFNVPGDGLRDRIEPGLAQVRRTIVSGAARARS
jgi:hypothetical protein